MLAQDPVWHNRPDIEPTLAQIKVCSHCVPSSAGPAHLDSDDNTPPALRAEG